MGVYDVVVYLRVRCECEFVFSVFYWSGSEINRGVYRKVLPNDFIVLYSVMYYSVMY